jgi:hypothetical protein
MNDQGQNSFARNLEANIFIENLFANLLSNEIINKVSPSRLKANRSTEFIIIKLVEIDEKQNLILGELEEIKKIIKKEK